MSDKIEEAKILIPKWLKNKKEPISFKEIVGYCHSNHISRVPCWLATKELKRNKTIENDSSLTKGRGAGYYLIENKKDILEQIVKKRNNSTEKNKIENKSTEFTENQRRHADEFKKHVIQPFLDWLPKIDDLKISFPKGLSPVENNVLFDDFKNHLIPEFGDPFSDYERFRKIIKDFVHNRETLRSHIVKDILEKQMALPPSHYKSREQRAFEGVEKEVKDDIDFYNKEGNCSYDSYDIADRIIDIINWWQSYNFDEKEFDYMYHTPISRVEEKNDLYEYYCCLDWDMPFAHIEKSSWHKTEKDLLKLMDKKVNMILNEVKTSEYLKSEILKLHKNKEQLVECRNNMNNSLTKYHHYQGKFPGNCEYCPS